MGFGEVDRTGDIVIEARKLTKAYDKPLFSDLNLSVLRGQCVGVLGPNGAGKSTLVKTLIGKVTPDVGRGQARPQGPGRLPRPGARIARTETTVLRAVWPEDDPDWVQGDVRDLLARFGLTGDLALHKVGQLSGGEKGKAALARLAATSANLLVMDEPTNHLDIWACDALERSIVEFEGTVLVVSHDRYFLNQVADRIIVVADGKAQVIEGDYETYQLLAAREAEAQARKAATAEASRAAAGPLPSESRADKKKRKYPYRKAPDVEAEIGRGRGRGRRPRRYPRPARHLARALQGDRRPGSPYRAQGEARPALRSTGKRPSNSTPEPNRGRRVTPPLSCGVAIGSLPAPAFFR